MLNIFARLCSLVAAFVCALLVGSGTLLFAGSGSDFLTDDERRWLAGLPAPVRIGITQIPNQVLLQPDGGYAGLAIDLLDEISLRLRMPLEWVYYDSWDELISAARRRDIDIVFAAQKTHSRLRYLHFTDPFLTLRNKIIVRMDAETEMEIEELQGKVTAVARGSAVAEFLQRNFPEIMLMPVDSEFEALRLLASGEVDAAVSEPVRAAYYIKRHYFDNLRIGGDTGYVYELRIASRNDWPMLNVVLTKALAEIPDEHIQALQFKWGYNREWVDYFDRQTLLYIGGALGLLLAFAFFLYLSNRRLRHEVARRRDAELQLNRNIATLTRREQQLREARLTAEKANLAKTRFLASMSHDLRTPLNAMLGYIELVQQALHPESLEAHRCALIRRSGSHLLRLIEDLLDITAIEAGKVDVVEEPVDLYRLLDDLHEMMAPAAREKGLRYETYQAAEFPRVVCTDGRRLRQVLQNLVDNAIKYTDQGHVSVHAGVGEREGGGLQLRFEVVDSGRGIAPEARARLFHPFEQKETSGRGLGLGLAICQQLTGSMGGRLTLVSEVGKGSRFRIELPVTLPAESVAPIARYPFADDVPLSAEKPLLGRRFLVVDDIRLNRELVRAFLEKAGATVELAQSGREVLAIMESSVSREPYDAILIDVRMPDVDGLETTRRLREKGLLDKTIVIGQTADATMATQAGMRAAGMADWLIKPFDYATLLTCLMRHFGNHEKQR